MADALAYLDDHVNFETAPARRMAPTLDRMRAVCTLLGDPQTAYPVVHITGTNGKGSTARMASRVLGAHGLTVGTYTSPHLERLNERLAVDGEPIDDGALASALLGLRPYEDHLDVRLTHFEVLTAAALRWFADLAVDVAVLEVGLGGRYDSTNVADADVAVITNIGLDHVEVIGPSRLEIAGEKAGIIKPGSTVVLGEVDPALADVFGRQPAAAVWRRGDDFGCRRNAVAVGGRVLDLYTPTGRYDEVFVPLHGPHQGDNAACALAAAAAFFGRDPDHEVVAEAFAGVSVPGRCEVVRRHPLVVLDGAHNPDGARALRRTLEEDFNRRYPEALVVGFTQGRDPAEMLTLLGATSARVVVAVPPPSPRGIDPAAVVSAARGLGLEAVSAPNVALGVARAIEGVSDAEFVVVTGSLYVVGDARKALHRA